MKARYWPDEYIIKRKTAEQAVKAIPSGQRVFIGSSCGEPQHLVKSLVDHSSHFSDLEIVRLLSLESSPMTLIANQNKGHNFTVRNIYQGSASSKSLSINKRFIMPMNLSAVPNLFKKKQLPLYAALIQVSPPDDFGWMSLGISVDVGLAAARAAKIVIAQVNSQMPRVLGHSFIHVNDVDIIVEYDEPLLSVESLPEFDFAGDIAKLVAGLIDDGSTIQLGLGATPQAIFLALSEKNDLGIHTQFITDGIMNLAAIGVISNRYKGLNEGKIVGSNAIGTRNLYEYLNDNSSIEFYPSDYVNHPTIISKHNKMVSVNLATTIDLTGQVAADALPQNYFSGVTGILDFVRGAAHSSNGKSIIIIPSITPRNKISRIVPMLDNMAVVIPRGDVYYVVSEYGAVNLYGKSFQERATALISLAHPDFRDELYMKAVDMGLIEKSRTLSEALYGVYPAKMEYSTEINGQLVRFRPAKPVDDRRIQEHFYNMDKKDVIARFFYDKTSFFRDDMLGMFQVDYIKRLTVVALTGEFGFGKVIGLGMYALEPDRNVAEVAFSVLKEWQGKGISSIILNQLADAARKNGLSGLVAYTSPTNKGMIRLFKKLPYKVKTTFDEDILMLLCDFYQPETNKTLHNIKPT